MIRSVRCNIPVLHFCCAGSRSAMTMLAVALPTIVAVSFHLRRATPFRPSRSADPLRRPAIACRKSPQRTSATHRQRPKSP